MTSTPEHLMKRKNRGFALVIVLGSLIFLSAIILAFLSSAGAERQSAQNFANTNSVKQLSDTAVNLVMAQIRTATSGTNSAGETLAWASQPGMIRNFDTTGNLTTAYKLYSSGTLTLNGSVSQTTESDEIKSWRTNKAAFTDLNEPITTGTTKTFPIFDPASITSPNPVAGASVTIPPDFETSPQNPNAPMPVRWLYVLKDGSIVPPVESGATANIPNASATNPVTGRIAFWTDDETSKVNINTAAGGQWVDETVTNYPLGTGAAMPAPATGVNAVTTYTGPAASAFWDTPRVNTPQDKYLARVIPPRNEFYRFPGHPAGVFLGAVFPDLTGNEIRDIIPRVSGTGAGGSLGTNGGKAVPGSAVANPIKSVVPDNDRLYASVDELIYSASTSTPNRPANSGLNATSVAQRRFFLTANSRAPEVNIFNLPRVGIWPIRASAVAAQQTAGDRLVALAGTLPTTSGSSIYYFQRNNSKSNSADLPTAVATTGVGRNRALMQYLRTLTTNAVPGFGGQGILKKYNSFTPNTSILNPPLESDQILTQVFDYIRAINAQDQNLTAPNQFSAGIRSLPYTVGGTPPTSAPFDGFIVPIFDQTTRGRGFGRYPTVAAVSLVFVGAAQRSDVVTTGTTGNSAEGSIRAVDPSRPPTGTTVDPVVTGSAPLFLTGTLTGKFNADTDYPPNGQTRLRAFFVIDFFIPGIGYGPASGETERVVEVKVDGLNSFTWNGASMDFPATATVRGLNSASYGDRAWGGLTGPRALARKLTPSVNYPLVSGTTLDVNTGGTFNFGGGDITITLQNNAAPSTEFQTVKVTVPSFNNSPIPLLAPMVTLPATLATTSTNPITLLVTVNPPAPAIIKNFANILHRLEPTGSEPGSSVFLDRDVIKSVEFASSDYRLSAALQNVPSALFSPHPLYALTTGTHAHRMSAPQHQLYAGALTGRYVPGALYTTGTFNIPPGATVPNIYTPSVFTSSTAHIPTLNLNGTITSPAPPSGYYPSHGQPIINSSSASLRAGVNNPITSATNGILVGGAASGINIQGDYDNGRLDSKDGAYINHLPDLNAFALNVSGPDVYQGFTYEPTALNSPDLNVSPNRLVPSAGVFGSLPTGVVAQRPWQTLLFRPSPNVSSVTHPGFAQPRDHLLLDLFTMPVVDPYPISDPLSSAGKVNLNYQIMPFSYITRSTAIRAALRSEWMLAIPNSQSADYKVGAGAGVRFPATTGVPASLRYPINLDETLTGFQNKFALNDIFRSPSEICDIWLVPQNVTTGSFVPLNPTPNYSNISTFWNNYGLTGDDNRERPYANIYQRLTTKSNTYTVHFRVQQLKKAGTGPSVNHAVWDEDKDKVEAEYRGSSLIERYVDLNEPNAANRMPDYAAASNPFAATPISNFYKFRVVSSKQFTP